MQIILVQDVPHLGSLGDEVHVKDGFARNYLLPRGIAIMAGKKNFAQIEHNRKRLDQLRNEAIEKAQTESEKVAALELRVQAKAGVSGKLFGSVTNRDIQAVLAEHGYELDRRSIQLQTPIKSVGNFTVTVKLHTAVKVEVAVKVTPLTGTETGAKGDQAVEGEGVEGATAEGDTVETDGTATEAMAPSEETTEPLETTEPVEADEPGNSSEVAAEPGDSGEARSSQEGNGQEQSSPELSNPEQSDGAESAAGGGDASDKPPE